MVFYIQLASLIQNNDNKISDFFIANFYWNFPILFSINTKL